MSHAVPSRRYIDWPASGATAPSTLRTSALHAIALAAVAIVLKLAAGSPKLILPTLLAQVARNLPSRGAAAAAAAAAAACPDPNPNSNPNLETLRLSPHWQLPPHAVNVYV
ncbi:uncharacterized protein SAPINGB_P003178 [Magnusiomyces paraingens]|uniref:Uncharacterized protein n=1 Tax=Magnusiomyces paraingens TaxID=2606893 RepID=A0A5E8BJ49_9ASCO|nr:uncharacterized protein SAPINGB_P003178 [Saprochaete ingens]VVT51684.1 unnamed protein product [Saprochaete ingens]